MEKDRFELIPGENLIWKVTDKENGIVIDFREGLFNKTQVVKIPAGAFKDGDAMRLATILREIADWMALNHMDVALCDWKSRRSAVWKLSDESFWQTMAAATNGLQLSEMKAEDASWRLYAEVCDWIESEDLDLTAAKEENLKGVLSELTNSEAWEVYRMLHAFWKYKGDQGHMMQWSLDVTWWPAWLPGGMKAGED